MYVFLLLSMKEDFEITVEIFLPKFETFESSYIFQPCKKT